MSHSEIEAHGLQSWLRPRVPITGFGGWAMCLDALAAVVSLLAERSPELVVELGSGVSTVVLGCALRKLGRGRLVSFEHEPPYFDATSRSIALHRLGDVVSVCHAPLVPGVHGVSWYDPDRVRSRIGGPIDVLLVDGPPGPIHPDVRAPALPVLHDRLSESAIILLDDAFRAAEQRVLERWTSEFGLEFAIQRTEKGLAVGEWRRRRS